MSQRPVMVVGAGLAGLSAGIELARAGHSVMVIDQAMQIGGAIHRQPLPELRRKTSAAHARRWQALRGELDNFKHKITLCTQTRFGGLDSTGLAILTGFCASGSIRPVALVLATGARERVQPRPGWTLPGVITAGAIQIQLKTLGSPPDPSVLLAGSGPLLLAVGAELCKAGRPPLAIVEAAQPFAHPLQALQLPWVYWREAVGYMSILMAARVPLLTGSHLTMIAETAEGLKATVQTPSGVKEIVAGLVGLHDGISPNDTGLPDKADLPMLRVGDCREALGARAALADGRAGGRRLAAMLAEKPEPPDVARDLACEVRAQRLLKRIYQHDGESLLSQLPDHTVLCRCEGKTLGDLKALGSNPTVRELRLDGRFGMGPCQGRFCAEWVKRLSGFQADPDTSQRNDNIGQIGTTRWPIRPIAIADLLSISTPLNENNLKP